MRRVVVCLPAESPRVDPSPAATGTRDVELAFAWDGSAAGVVGFGEGGITALELASAYPDLVGRLVLVSTPIPTPATSAPAAVGAKTLLLYGSRGLGNAAATWWRNRLGGRIEMVPGAGDDILAVMWPRVLSHLAPRAVRT